MNRPSLIAALPAGCLAIVTLLGATAAPAEAAARPADAQVSFAGTVALDDCSGSVIRTPTATDDEPAMVMTNGHCLESGMPAAGQVITDQPSSRTFTLLDANANQVGTLQATKVLYATMTDTDITLYQLSSTYAQIRRQYQIDALPLATTHPVQGDNIEVVSGYWQSTYSCAMDGFAYEVKEADWTWKDSVRYTPDCHVIGGTSGSPVIDTSTGQVVAVNNTTNENGEQCTLNNPCEVDQNGNVTIHQGIGYAEETYLIAPCVGSGNQIDLTLPNCALPKP
ncbi:S1 family peptidase [Streptomyces sp. NPDC002521]